MKYIFLFSLVIVVFTQKSVAQGTIYYHYFAKGERVKNAKKATYTRKVVEDVNSLKIYIIKNDKGIIFSSTEYRSFDDNNNFKEYAEKGKYSIAYDPELINGYKKSWNSSNQIIDSSVFINKKLVYNISFRYQSNGLVFVKKEKDYINNKFSTIIYAPSGKRTFEKNFEKDKGVAIDYDDNGSVLKIDSLMEADEREASFPGGNDAWKKYLETNLNADVATKNGAKVGEYKIVLQFIVEPDGTVSDVKALSNLGYGMEQEGVRVISNSPKWKSARENGRDTRAYRKQYLWFYVYRDKK